MGDLLGTIGAADKIKAGFFAGWVANFLDLFRLRESLDCDPRLRSGPTEYKPLEWGRPAMKMDVSCKEGASE